MRKRMRISNEKYEEAHNYMKVHWCHDSDRWDDFTAVEVAGDTELLADMIVSAGAINSKLCYEYAQPIERVCEELARRFRRLTPSQQKKRIDRAFENCFIASCNDCNVVSFVYDGNEDLYPDLKTDCFECNSKNLETYYWRDK